MSKPTKPIKNSNCSLLRFQGGKRHNIHTVGTTICNALFSDHHRQRNGRLVLEKDFSRFTLRRFSHSH